MTLVFEVVDGVPDDVEAIVVPVGSDGLGESGFPADLLAAQGFEGKPGQVVVMASFDGPDRIGVGVGATDDVDVAAIRRAAAVMARAVSRRSFVASRLLDVVDESERSLALQALVEAMSLATYRYTKFKSDPKPVMLERVAVIGRIRGDVAEVIERGIRIADGVALARDLVNEPGGSLTPRRLAEVAVEIAEREDLQITIFDDEDIVEARLGGLLGVNRGSTEPPRFIQLCYEPENPEGFLALVGKGVTFDSGGLSIKSGEAMMTMKMDLGGAAAILGAMSAVRAVSPRCRIRAYIPATDNMSNGDATRPGDVLRIRNGKTVEVLNTDAEGRLILADALSLASEDQPDAIVDLATLTGAIEIALGSRIAGLMGNSDGWIAQVKGAAGRAGERVWQLPMPDDYRSGIESDVADLRNVAKTRYGGSITAALFLREFVGEGIPWAHIDIAGTAWWRDPDDGEFTKGGTGYGVRLLLELARTFQPPNGGPAAD